MKKKVKASVQHAFKSAVKTMAIGTAMNISGQLTKLAIDKLSMLLHEKMVYTVSFDYRIGMLYKGLEKFFKHLPMAVEMDSFDNFEPVKIKSDIMRYTGEYFEMTMYKGVPICLYLHKNSSDNSHRTDGVSFSVLTPNTPKCRNTVKDFLTECVYITRKYRFSQKASIELCDRREYGRSIEATLRTFDDVFIPNEDKNMLKNALDAYIHGREFYEENRLPNHFGILLHGKGGVGKSSLVQAIASYTNAQLYCMTGDDLKYLPRILDSVIFTRPPAPEIYRILLIEDIDSWVFSKDRDMQYYDNDNEDDNKVYDVGLATILNCIDGIGSPENIIYIFTTNHVEMLDPALIRPGRMDLSLEMKYVVPETLVQFLKFHYPDEEIPEIKHVRDGITFAELQTLVLQKKTMGDIINHCSNPD